MCCYGNILLCSIQAVNFLIWSVALWLSSCRRRLSWRRFSTCCCNAALSCCSWMHHRHRHGQVNFMISLTPFMISGCDVLPSAGRAAADVESPPTGRLYLTGRLPWCHWGEEHVIMSVWSCFLTHQISIYLWCVCDVTVTSHCYYHW